ncbi:type VII secretion-associated protein [Mycobacterium sp. Aquia_216]|uniref:type VII secretion-associated protein n=1 Tax=Mycobacterium sp. Aquia_216 TaxID=2991729 RepID=UPI00227D6D95|nr:type VII secretion-associated protein [Mycobacterium sp. Aquia_216]WAJ46201.1 type VII secretion-associated protein [Mycobacterium sp. Aquia_216]
MSGHRAVIATGLGRISRLCCGTGTVDDDIAEILHAALDAIDDQVALVDGRPLAVDSLWRGGLRSLHCGNLDAQKAIQVVHPSWWPSSRVDVVAAAAAALSDDVQVRPRSWLLRQATGQQAAVVVEIAERLVAIAADDVVAVARGVEHHCAAEQITRLVAEMTEGKAATVLIDVPAAVSGAQALATVIAAGLRRSGQKVVEVDWARLLRLTGSGTFSAQDEVLRPQSDVDGHRVRSRRPMFAGFAVAAAVFATTMPAITAGRHRDVAPTNAAPTTYLVEGRVALTVPAQWPTQRVVAGPGSARVQVSSPSDPEVALHVTQSPIPVETLSATADRLRRAIDTEPAGVFVDFDPAGFTAGRPAVTYREVRPTHHVRWTVLVDGSVRISVGCQSRPGGEDAVRDVCAQAVRSAHAIG